MLFEITKKKKKKEIKKDYQQVLAHAVCLYTFPLKKLSFIKEVPALSSEKLQ